ncbi:hypothetical protein ASPZODRAFT_130738 [Penicilliopsis zonata CBS 506.65]|uniref:Oxidation resistance protein 1 n=1 Tax=Penicilliopsis zonata CBS 506.65 TaxID=1073090 RepID=A0A1L9SN58_9EURO|nr:hypothetical protein ASPZODRAFT_130738 [Penicilliopsis zonata CBS 506.65]OJJ48640.1 hypothetical protein ASPZODRAFT_130738 [Penicilliopsis zonata CBS 506.65]
MSSSTAHEASVDHPTSSVASSRSGSQTPHASNKPSPQPYHQSTASYLSYPVSHVVSGLYRRLTDPNVGKDNNNSTKKNGASKASKTTPSSMTSSFSSAGGIYTPHRTASPFQPPPLTPLTLLTSATGLPSQSLQQQLLTRALAEEIRLLVPARLQLVDTWRLAYSLDRDGASLATLYENCKEISHRSPRAGYVLVVRDSLSSAAVFGAYMTDPPHPSPHYFGTGECFLWRASVLAPPTALGLAPGPQAEELLELAGLPLPPSADTTNAGRSTTLRMEKAPRRDTENGLPDLLTTSLRSDAGAVSPSGTSTPERIRFKAFPYSGVNDYMIFCETGFLSLGAGDGHYGLWLDSSFEKGVSASCETFGNEPLSDEGTKFDVLGVEVWYVGA